MLVLLMEQSKTINIYLSGGGFKGAFQGGFLYRLGEWLEVNSEYRIGKIYGSSIGAINGSIFLDNYKNLKIFWDNIKSYKSMTKMWINIPLIGKIISIIYGFFVKCGLINPIKFHNMIRKYCYHNNNDKLNICTTNLTQSKVDFIDCSNNINKNNIVDYIIASSSLWLFSPPIKINKKYYADGGILKFLPINETFIINNNINIVLSAAKNIEPYNEFNTKNLLFYLDYLIHMTCDILYENDINKIFQLNNFKCYFINQKLLENISILSFNQNNIDMLWNNGMYSFDSFMQN